MKRILTPALCLLASGALCAQTAEPPERIVRRVADHILATTSFAIVDPGTGGRWTTTEGLAYSPTVRVESPYNQWEYWNGVMTVGLVRLAGALHEPRYADYSRHEMAFIFAALPYFRRQYDAGVREPSLFEWFRMGRLDDCGAMSAGLADVYALDPRPEYRAYLDRAAAYVSSGQMRLPDGTLARAVPRSVTLWADDLYMSVPFLARMGRITGDSRYFDDAIRQVEAFNRYLYDPAEGIYFHCWYGDERCNGVAHWGRCNGWLMMAQVELLSQLPADHPKRAELIGLLHRQVAGIARYQDAGGMWHQVLDRPDSYLESSCTAMFTYGIARAVNEGWINPGYLSVARNGWQGLSTRIDSEGRVADICIGTGISDDIAFYYNRPRRLNDIHGLGAVLMAGVEIIKAQGTPPAGND